MSPRSLLLRVKRAGFRLVRRALVRYARARPRSADAAGADQRVLILLMSAWGMGGTIRAAHNLAGHLARQGYEVEIASVFRLRDESWLGQLPAGVTVTALDDHRPTATPRHLRRLRKWLRRFSSVLAHPADYHGDWWNLWVDVRLVRKLHRRTGFLITTRPSLNLIAAELSPPGLIRIGQEQINLGTWSRTLRKAMARSYPRLDALVALTDDDVDGYDQLLSGRLRLERIPNTVHRLDGGDPDMSTRTVLAAGRLTTQKGFDFLIPAFARVAAGHPGWRLRICGKGRLRAELQQMIDERGMTDAIELAGPSERMGEEMANASIFVLSSRFEGFPLILIEAMSKGMAVVSFDCPTGPREMIDDHRNGILVPPKDVSALAAGIEELVEDEELRRRVGAAAVESSREYGIDAIGPRWEALFAELRNGRFRR